MEIFTLTLQALIEFCAGNYENQEVMVYQQISSDLNWILSIENTDNCQVRTCIKSNWYSRNFANNSLHDSGILA